MGRYAISLPDIGEGIAEAELTNWTVKIGDLVAEDDILGEVMTDKAAVEVPTTVAGRVVWLAGEPGDMLAIGDRFVVLEVEGEGNISDDEPLAETVSDDMLVEDAPASQVAIPKADAPKPARGAAVLLPDVGEGVAEAEIAEWSVRVGDVVSEDDILGAVMTDKATVEIPSPAAGKIAWLAGDVGDVIAVGSPFVRFEGDADTQKTTEHVPEPVIHTETETIPSEDQTAVVATPSKKAGTRVLASPAVRRQARDAGIDLANVPGTGPGRRVSKADLRAYMDARSSGGARRRPQKDGSKEIKVIGMRRRIAEKMVISKARIPHITIVEEVDMTELEELRGRLNKKFSDDRGKLTVIPFVIRAIAGAVATCPEMNATFDEDAQIITQHDGIHIGIATQTDAGLTVPVIRHTEALSPWDAASELRRLSEAARQGKAKLEDLSGSTITITSLGPLGAIATTPIINHPEVAIVGINKMAVRPMWDGREFQPRKMMNISCSFDHRLIDGWNAAVFVQELKSQLETPALLFLET